MIRGLLSGVALGALVAGLGIVGLSLSTPLVTSLSVEPGEISALSPEPVRVPLMPPVPSSPDVLPGTVPSLPAPIVVEEAAPLPQPPAPEPSVLPAPVVENTPQAPSEPASVAEPSASEPPAPEPNVRFNQAATAQVSTLPSIDTSVATPTVAAPVAPITSGPAIPQLETQSADVPSPVAALPQGMAPGENGLPQISPNIGTSAPMPKFQPAPLAEGGTRPQFDIAALETSPSAPQPAPPVATPIEETQPVPQVAVVTPRILELGQDAPGTVVGRIALQGGLVTDTQRTAQQEVVIEAPSSADGALPAVLPALLAHAIPFERISQDLPVMSIVLIDTPESRLDRVTLLGFSLPVTFAVDPTQPDAAEAVRSYRANGFEVVLLAKGLPQDGTAQDIEGAFDGAVGVVNEAVAVLDTPDGLLQNTRPALDAVLGRLRTSGHGLLTFSQGLNGAQAAAERAGVAGLTVYRMLDADQEQSSVVGRYLDRATFAAGQQGHAIVVGHSYADTVTALYSWQQSNRASTVQVAPVSYLLQQYGQ